MHPDRRKARAALASAAARASRNPEDPAAAEAVIELRRQYHAVTLEEHVRRVVAQFPPLTPAQRNQIATLLREVPEQQGTGDSTR